MAKHTKRKGKARKKSKKSRAARARSARPAAPDRSRRAFATRDFQHVSLLACARSARPLRGDPDSLVVLSEPRRDAMRYYLSTLRLVHAALGKAPKRRPGAENSQTARTVRALREAAHRIPSLPFLEISASSRGGAAAAAPVAVQVHKRRPVKLVVNDIRTIKRQLPHELHTAVATALESAPRAAEAPVGAAADAVAGSPPRPPGKGLPAPPPPPAPEAGRQALESFFGADRPVAPPPDAPFEPPADDRSRWRRAKPPDRGAVAASPGASPAGPEDPALRVYPEIAIENPHPVQGSEFDILVSLNFKPSEATIGSAAAPSDNLPHVFDVHLLVGNLSKRAQLKFQRPTGTLEKAEFRKIQAPVLDGSELAIAGHFYVDVTVNFYLENRWCGEALRRIEVRAAREDPPSGAIPVPADLPWRKDLLVQPGTPPPDLLIRIKRTAGEFRWKLFSPFMNFSADQDEMSSPIADPYRYVKDHFEIFAGANLTDGDIDTLCSHCDLIYQATPIGFQKAYRALLLEVAADPEHKRLETIQIVSDEAFIPWELMRVSDPSDAPAFPPEILCVKHSVGRWMAAESSELRSRLEVEKMVVSASDYTLQNVAGLPTLPWAAGERQFLVDPPYKALNIPLQLPDLLAFLKRGSAEVIHFSCHGDTDVLAPDKATLRTEDDPVGLRAPSVATPEARAGAGHTHPVVFLNACQAAAGGNFIGMVFGWPQAFLRMGATACVAPLWKVVDQRAKEIAEEFYVSVLTGNEGQAPVALGEALRRIRSQWKEKKSLTHLGYLLYGDPTTLLTHKQSSPPPVS